MRKKQKLLLVVVSCLILLSGCQQAGQLNLEAKPGEVYFKVLGKPEILKETEVIVEGLGRKKLDEKGVTKFTEVESKEYQVIIKTPDNRILAAPIKPQSGGDIIMYELENAMAVEPTVVDANEYIDVDDTTVQFLFKTEIGNKVEFYLGKDKDNLKKVKAKTNFKNQGVRLTDLTPGEKYYYQIKAKQGGKTAASEVRSFSKLDNTNNWEPADWARTSVFYEVFVRSFYDGNGDGIGDFAGLKEKIPYFKELGVDALWLMPVNDSPSYHCYDVKDYYETDPDYGTREEFREFLKAAHKNGLKVIMDLVVNHSSTKHPWFQKAKTMESKYTDYYIWRDKFTDINEIGPWGQQVWHKVRTPEYYYGIFWDQMPDLNHRNPEVREEMKEVAKFWLDPNGDGDFSDGVDGFRLDAAMHIDDKRPVVTHNWWQEFNTAVKEVNPDAFLVGENWTDDTEEIAKFYNDLDASFNFNTADNLLKLAQGESVDVLAELKEIHQLYEEESKEYIDATFLRNHDQNRVASVLDNNRKQMKLAASLLFTMPGTPFIYYGEEIGQLGKKPDDNIREPFDWYEDAKGPGMTTMEKGGFYHSMQYTKADDGISLAEERAKEDSLFNHYKKLIAIRKNNPILFTGEYTKQAAPESIYGYRVSSSDVDYNLFIAHNTTDQPTTIQISAGAEELLTNKSYKAGSKLELIPYSTVILKTTADNLKLK